MENMRNQNMMMKKERGEENITKNYRKKRRPHELEAA